LSFEQLAGLLHKGIKALSFQKNNRNLILQENLQLSLLAHVYSLSAHITMFIEVCHIAVRHDFLFTMETASALLRSLVQLLYLG